MHKWEIKSKLKTQTSKADTSEIVKILLSSRKIKTKKELEEFLNPKLEKITAKSLGIKESDVVKTVGRVKKAIKDKEQIIVFGDYDVDGVCGAAILWESLTELGSSVMPYIPHRTEEGYGLSKIGIDSLLKQYPKTSLIITVDNGIVAFEAVDYANEKGIDVIITDHHVPASKLPKAYSIFHTTKICGAAVAWILTRELSKAQNDHLSLVTLATVADLMPLLSENRAFVKFGLEELRKTKRVGLIELFKEASLDPLGINTYEIGHIIAPRLNAMGRLEHAMDSLRLVCTNSPERARELAHKLGRTNKERQYLTQELFQHAKKAVGKIPVRKKLIFLYHESYQPGVIGLIAGRLVEEFYRPAIVVYKGEIQSKASARSVAGFNIVEFIRGAQKLLIDVGGHPMAAGFSLETIKIDALEKQFEKLASRAITSTHLKKVIKVDLEMPASVINFDLYNKLQDISPFGMGNPEPTFMSKGFSVGSVQYVGMENNHLRLVLLSKEDQRFEAIAFGWGDKAPALKTGDKVDVVYTIEQREWNRNKTLRLKVKDVHREKVLS